MKIALTGASGQLGQAFREIAGRDHEILPYFHSGTDPSSSIDLEDPATFCESLRRRRPDAVVHAAAMTDVDGCERAPERAMQVNGRAMAPISQTAAAIGARLVYVSTDYVFDGEKGRYSESDATNPLSAYGRSKLLGEDVTLQHAPSSIIARTSVVFGPHKKNFVLWAHGELKARRPMRIVKDQRVSPTLTFDLARQILHLLERRAAGVYHTAGATALSRLEMVGTIAEVFGFNMSNVTPIASSDLNWVAPRPRDSSLDVGKISRMVEPYAFKKSLEILAKRLNP